MRDRGELSRSRRQPLADYFYRDLYIAHRYDDDHYQRVLSRIEELVPNYRPSPAVESHLCMRMVRYRLNYRIYIPVHNALWGIRQRWIEWWKTRQTESTA